MKRTLAVVGAVFMTANLAFAQKAPEKASGAAAHAPVMNATDGVWGPAPAVFPAGAQLAVLAGNPGAAGEYTVRLKMPAGYKIMPHFHPTDENVTIVSGTLHVGLGEQFTEEGALTLAAGGFITAPANMAHYVWADGETVVQVHGIGPFQLTYVNPADMPKQ